MLTYRQLRDKQQKEFNAFPCFYAFSDQQFREGLCRLDCTEKELYRGPGGMFYRKSDSEKLKDLMNGFSKELEEAYKDDKFLYDAFLYELGNHEYCITLDLTDTLDALGLTLEEVQSDSRIITILRQAEQEYLKGVE